MTTPAPADLSGRADHHVSEAGVVEGCRGCVTILDRARLKEASCGCHRAITAEYDRLLLGFACVAQPDPSMHPPR